MALLNLFPVDFLAVCLVLAMLIKFDLLLNGETCNETRMFRNSFGCNFKIWSKSLFYIEYLILMQLEKLVRSVNF